MSQRQTCPLCLQEVHHSRGYFPRFHAPCAQQAYAWSVYGFETPPVAYRAVTRLGPVCYLCGVEPSRDVEHIVPASLGGADEWGNLGAACSPCNSRKGVKLDMVRGDALARLKEQQAAYRASFERNRDAATDAVVDLVRHSIGGATFSTSREADIWREEAAQAIVEVHMEIELTLLDMQVDADPEGSPPVRDAVALARPIATAAALTLLPDEPSEAVGRDIDDAFELWLAGVTHEDCRPLLGGSGRDER